MKVLEKLLRLQAPADGDGSAPGSGGTPAADAGAVKDETKGADAAATAGDKKDEKGASEGARKSVLKGGVAGDGDAKKDAGKDSDAKDAGAKAKDGAADAYEVKVPEGVKVEKADLERWTKDAKEMGLSAEQASKLIAYQDQFAKAAVQAQVDGWAKQGETWFGELEKDSEFGGASHEASMAALQKALVKFDPKGELVADLEKYGIDNLPSLAKFLRRVGLAGAEDAATLDTSKKEPALSEDKERLLKRYDSPDMQRLMDTKK